MCLFNYIIQFLLYEYYFWLLKSFTKQFVKIFIILSFCKFTIGFVLIFVAKFLLPSMFLLITSITLLKSYNLIRFILFSSSFFSYIEYYKSLYVKSFSYSNKSPTLGIATSNKVLKFTSLFIFNKSKIFFILSLFIFLNLLKQ